MQQDIEGFYYDLSKPVKLLSTKNKFWKATLEGTKITIEVGKQKAGAQELQKDMVIANATLDMAKSNMISKIRQKLIKGYYSAVPVRQKKQEPTLKRRTRSATKIGSKSGGFFEKSGQSVMFEINENKIRVTRTGKDKKQKVQTRDFPNSFDAVAFFQSQEQWLLSQGYTNNSEKYTNTFSTSGTETRINFLKPENPKDKSANSRSIVNMTDDAISRSSKSATNHSVARSVVSAGDDDSDDQSRFKPSDLGPHSSGPIKVLLAETWNDTYDPTGYYVSEKLDGVRCFWTGTKMFSREGNAFYPPKWFVAGWPKSQLDGQLFIGRDRFSETISTIKKKVPIDSEWQKVVYLVFDAPGLKKPFRQRVQIMQKTIKTIDNAHIKCHAHRICSGFPDLAEELEAVQKVKGEGLMLRHPESHYENRRSKNLLKVKTFYDDQATILGFQPGSGRCQGMVGAFKCRNTHGVEFEIGSGLNDAMRKKPPKIGTVITYKYQEFNKDSGKPRFPIFLRIYQPL